MKLKKILPVMGSLLAGGVLLAAYRKSKLATNPTDTPERVAKTTKQMVTEADVANAQQLLLDPNNWHYNAQNKVYYQVGIKYGTKTSSRIYESMGIFIPEKYMTVTQHDQKTYSLAVNPQAALAGYTARTAPIVMRVKTPRYAAQAAPTDYDGQSAKYTDAGFVYVAAGCRGLDSADHANGAAPWGITDLKAAVRTLRLNQASLAGDTDRIFTFGHSGGGAQSALMGATGDSQAYIKYLKAIGAPLATMAKTPTSDAIAGAMVWCPITSLDTANEAYEWNMGQYSSVGTRKPGTWTKALSTDMAASYAQYINRLGLKDSQGQPLELKRSATGIDMAGTYAAYLKQEVEQSLNIFLQETRFPYETSSDQNPKIGAPNGPVTHQTYQTVQEYIDALNGNDEWIRYDAQKNRATITSLAAFVKHCKPAVKAVGAFDGLTRQQTENQLFATSGCQANHFDATIGHLLKQHQATYSQFAHYQASYASAYRADLQKTDAQGSSIQTRLNMYNPMYYLTSYYAGHNTSKVAKYWRIRTGINQPDTALPVETNLALALKQNSQVKSVDFATVWGQGHIRAERQGNHETNFIEWINRSLK
ncbi:tannase [Levilactobacillus suantsaii]|uniref:Tannase n=1 Tax=Levilactobacillus suantsaii TaxID=2292255 RepID=A0A4Q0VIH3_9LACO|nr:tannase [Levilactobacillus suantsaii]RXI77035.1 tannase [Levilactobacillus suantsaii]